MRTLGWIAHSQLVVFASVFHSTTLLFAPAEETALVTICVLALVDFLVPIASSIPALVYLKRARWCAQEEEIAHH